MDIQELISEGQDIFHDLNSCMKWRTHDNSIPVRMIEVGQKLRGQVESDEQEILSEMSDIFRVLMSEGDHSRSVHINFGERIEAFLSKVNPAPAFS